MTRYAERTSVSSYKSKEEIERTLVRYKADQFASGWSMGAAVIKFSMAGRHVRFTLPLPSREDEAFATTPGGKKRKPQAVEDEYEQAVRQRWRALALVIKAKLEAVEAGITEFDEEFMAHIVLPDGKTIGDAVIPQIKKTYMTGKLQPLLSFNQPEGM